MDPKRLDELCKHKSDNNLLYARLPRDLEAHANMLKYVLTTVGWSTPGTGTDRRDRGLDKPTTVTCFHMTG